MNYAVKMTQLANPRSGRSLQALTANDADRLTPAMQLGRRTFFEQPHPSYEGLSKAPYLRSGASSYKYRSVLVMTDAVRD